MYTVTKKTHCKRLTQLRVTLTQPRNEMSLVGCAGIQGAWAGVPMYY
jgi:hypothetical protein